MSFVKKLIAVLYLGLVGCLTSCGGLAIDTQPMTRQTVLIPSTPYSWYNSDAIWNNGQFIQPQPISGYHIVYYYNGTRCHRALVYSTWYTLYQCENGMVYHNARYFNWGYW